MWVYDVQEIEIWYIKSLKRILPGTSGPIFLYLESLYSTVKYNKLFTKIYILYVNAGHAILVHRVLTFFAICEILMLSFLKISIGIWNVAVAV